MLPKGHNSSAEMRSAGLSLAPYMGCERRSLSMNILPKALSLLGAGFAVVMAIPLLGPHLLAAF